MPDMSSTGCPTSDDIQSTVPNKDSIGKFGRALRKAHFTHFSSLLRLNHGSYGAIPKEVLDHQDHIRRRYLQTPDTFYEVEHPLIMAQARKATANLVGANAKNIGLVDNATSAASSVASALAQRWYTGEWQQGDTVLYCSLTYDSTEHGFRHYCGRAGAAFESVTLPVPLSSQEEILDAFRTYLSSRDQSEGRIRVAVLDHIHSVTAYLMPLGKIIPLLRSAGIEFIFVDGAHAPGQLELNLQSLGCDAYCGNLHKWCYAPTGTAFLWASDSFLPSLHHPVVSHDWGLGFQSESDYTGTKDYSPYWSITKGLLFAQRMGGFKVVRHYCHNLAMSAGHMLATAWGTSLAQPEDMAAFMVAVQLPPELGKTWIDGANIRKVLYERGIQIQYPTVSNHGPPRLYVRISGQIYLEMADFEVLRDAILLLVAEKTTNSKL